MVRPENVYSLAWREATASLPAHLVWDTQEDGKAVEYTQEPARSSGQRFDQKVLSWLPFDREL
jgi:putative cardiolipin synthase